ncbi:MAG: hypothetical protein H4O13_14315 [Xanthomonadales bacterium]|nr:hypothetical protein [Xanthomonadales bacterium]
MIRKWRPAHLRRVLALFALASLLVGCIRGGNEPPPSSFARADPGFRDPQFPECPNLEGSYTLTPDPDSEFDPAAHFAGVPGDRTGAALLIERGPMGCRFDSGHLQPGESTTICGLQFRLRRASADVDRDADALRQSDPEAYARWWRVAREGVSLQGALHLNLHAYEQRLAQHGPVQDRGGALSHHDCEDGWLELESGFRDGYPQVVEIARDEVGGLIARQTVELSRSEITVWCGDGCKGIPYALETEARWARLAPGERPPMWSLDPQRLPPLVRATDPAMAASSQPALQLAVIEPVGVLPPPDSVEPLASFLRVFELEDRIRAQLDDQRIDIWRPEGKRVLVTGTTRNSAATHSFLRLLEADTEVARAELVSISVEGSRMRFSIFLDLRPR